jgi:hypothetical protein
MATTEGWMTKRWEDMDTGEKLDWLKENMVTRQQFGASLGNIAHVLQTQEKRIDALEKSPTTH